MLGMQFFFCELLWDIVSLGVAQYQELFFDKSLCELEHLVVYHSLVLLLCIFNQCAHLCEHKPALPAVIELHALVRPALAFQLLSNFSDTGVCCLQGCCVAFLNGFLGIFDQYFGESLVLLLQSLISLVSLVDQIIVLPSQCIDLILKLGDLRLVMLLSFYVFLFNQLNVTQEVSLDSKLKFVEGFRLNSILLLDNFIEVIKTKVFIEEFPNNSGSVLLWPISGKSVNFTQVHIFVSLDIFNRT